MSMVVIWQISIQQMAQLEKDRRSELASFHLLDNHVIANIHYTQTETGYVRNDVFEKKVMHNGKETTIIQLSH